MSTTRYVSPLILTTVTLLIAGGCSSSEPTITVEDAWAKAADSGMTAVFGQITNSDSSAFTITGGSSDVARDVELHEVADGIMREKPGGFVIDAGSTHSLTPGADHIMLMGLSEPVEPGDTLSVTLELDSGETLQLVADVRDYAGANEEYDPGHSEDAK